MTTLSEQDRRKLADWEDAAEFETVAENNLFMDSHGCMVVLIVVRQKAAEQDSPLYGFTCLCSSEERIFDEDSGELVPVVPRQVVTTVHDRADGDDWSDHV